MTMTDNRNRTSVRELMDRSGVAFGTSGVRGLVADMTDRVCYGYTTGFVQYLATLGEFAAGAPVMLAGDLRPSTPRILAACAAAIADAGGTPVFLGYVPTPTLAFHAFARGVPSLMVTGSHIPDDRNGIKFYCARREILKADEPGMTGQELALDEARFDAAGMLATPFDLGPPLDTTDAYVARYRAWFGPRALAGKRIGVYQHAAVGRDVLTRIVEELGATAVPLGRSEKFVPVDTEAIRPEDVALARGWAAELGLDAICSTDGDSDRPLLADEHGEWLRGDVLGVLCARALGASHVVTPVSSNTVAEKCGAFAEVVRTRIGSPYVIVAMDAALASGGALVGGYEANGGFLLGSDLVDSGVDGGRTMTALPTRDAVLPILAVLVAAGNVGLAALVAGLPPRFTWSDRIQEFPTAASQAIIARLGEGTDAERAARVADLFGDLAGEPVAFDRTDGLRITFANAEIIHLRPSGNAPELRCYAEAESAARAAQLAETALARVRAAA